MSSREVATPVEFSAGLVRLLEVPRPALNPLALAAACDAQGQELFAPPSVEGWVGGTVWINSSTLLERTNWAADVIWGRSENGLAPFDPHAWAARSKLPSSATRRAGWRSTPVATALSTDSARRFNGLPTAPSSNWLERITDEEREGSP